MWSQVAPAARLLGVMTVLTGCVYPAVVTLIAHTAFRPLADGSLLYDAGRPVGSRLIGQPFRAPHYFWSRPSATGSRPYDATASSGSNLGPTNPALAARVRERIAALQAADPTTPGPVPIDLVTASGSGLDPHVSVAAARHQLARVARARGLSAAVVGAAVAAATEHRQWGVLGVPRVNVLVLNRTLDRRPIP